MINSASLMRGGEGIVIICSLVTREEVSLILAWSTRGRGSTVRQLGGNNCSCNLGSTKPALVN